MSYKTHMHGSRESHSGVVPTKQPNESQGGPQEVVEGRASAKENLGKSNSYRTQGREASQAGWTGCGKQRRRIRDYGSQLCCTM